MIKKQTSQKYLWIWLGMAGIAVAVVVVLAIWLRPTRNDSNSTVNYRQRYADLYQAAWRQDTGQGSILMTATVLVPPAVSALEQDDSRSSSEEQIWQAVKNLSDKQVPIILTIDSVSGAVTDETIENSLSLATTSGPKFVLGTWMPLISPSRVVNTNMSTSSQIGIAVFSADQAIDWNTLGTLTLTSKGIGDQASRSFVWAQPALLLQAQ